MRALHVAVQVLVGFADKLRLMNVLMDDVKVIKEVGCEPGSQKPACKAGPSSCGQ